MTAEPATVPPAETLRLYRSRHSIVPIEGRCVTDGIRVLTRRGSGLRHHPDDLARLVKDAAMADLYRGTVTMAPPRVASPHCESGGHPGCTCDVCF